MALTQGDDQGFAFILQQVWDQLALELPALFEFNEIHECVPIPGPTLLWLIQELNQEDLQEAWTDDTTLGWLYQYWNDPDRKAVDAKLNTTSGKVEAHELSEKTQIFTERYMVEWLVQNSLGAQWLAICAKHGWIPRVQEMIEKLKIRREEWNQRISNEEVLETEPMPINGDEEFWKYYVPQ
ncbi:MAG: SAM-dependent methyltransferase, partial [bacterium]|nr:SAM-dependent methyltransferase [bacterium]